MSSVHWASSPDWGSSRRTASAACGRCSPRPKSDAVCRAAGPVGASRRTASIRRADGRCLDGTSNRISEARAEAVARGLLKRYGVVFRALLPVSRGCRRGAAGHGVSPARSAWRDSRRTLVGGFGGEQFALPDAVGRLRAVRKREKSGELTIVVQQTR